MCSKWKYKQEILVKFDLFDFDYDCDCDGDVDVDVDSPNASMTSWIGATIMEVRRDFAVYVATCRILLRFPLLRLNMIVNMMNATRCCSCGSFFIFDTNE